jgi:hypothetical protein
VHEIAASSFTSSPKNKNTDPSGEYFMSFLLAKILFLLVLAALLGAILASWWIRRQYRDVTDEYQRTNDEWRAWRLAIENKLAHRPEVDLSAVTARLGAIDSAVHSIEIPKPTTTDLGPVLSAIAKIPVPVAKDVDLAPLHARIADLESAVRGIEIPKPAAPDFAPVLAAIAKIPVPESKDVDLAPLHTRIAGLESAVRGIEIPKPATPDFGPVLAAIAKIPVPESKTSIWRRCTRASPGSSRRFAASRFPSRRRPISDRYWRRSPRSRAGLQGCRLRAFAGQVGRRGTDGEGN